MNKVDRVIEETTLGTLLGADGIEELRSKLIDTLVSEIRRELFDSYTEWIISPESITDELYQDVYNLIKEEYIEKNKAKIMAALDAKFGV